MRTPLFAIDAKYGEHVEGKIYVMDRSEHEAHVKARVLLWQVEPARLAVASVALGIEQQKDFLDFLRWEREHWWLPSVLLGAAFGAGAAFAAVAAWLLPVRWAA